MESIPGLSTFLWISPYVLMIAVIGFGAVIYIKVKKNKKK